METALGWYSEPWGGQKKTGSAWYKSTSTDWKLPQSEQQLNKSGQHCHLCQSSQVEVNIIHIAQNHNHIASVGFTMCTVNNILCPSIRVKKNSPGEKKTLTAGKKYLVSLSLKLKYTVAYNLLSIR